MNLYKFIQILRSSMARKKIKSGVESVLDQLRIQLIPVQNKNYDSTSQKQVVQQLISLMVFNLHKKGRPRKDDEGELAYAL